MKRETAGEGGRTQLLFRDISALQASIPAVSNDSQTDGKRAGAAQNCLLRVVFSHPFQKLRS